MHGSDTDKQIFFYEHEFYVFSNFSSFAIEWKGKLYMTSEHAYHSEQFEDINLKEQIRKARSAHDALKLAESNKDKYRSDWGTIKLKVMKEILRAKVAQHPYVKKKLIESGDKELIEDLVFDFRDFIEIKIKHVIEIKQIELPKGVNEPQKLRALAKRKGILKRIVKVDGKEQVREKEFAI